METWCSPGVRFLPKLEEGEARWPTESVVPLPSSLWATGVNNPAWEQVVVKGVRVEIVCDMGWVRTLCAIWGEWTPCVWYGVNEDLVCTAAGATSDIPSWDLPLPPKIVFARLSTVLFGFQFILQIIFFVLFLTFFGIPSVEKSSSKGCQAQARHGLKKSFCTLSHPF